MEAPVSDEETCTVEAQLDAAHVDALRRSLPGTTGGEGILESTFAGYQPIGGSEPPRRAMATGRPPHGRAENPSNV